MGDSHWEQGSLPMASVVEGDSPSTAASIVRRAAIHLECSEPLDTHVEVHCMLLDCRVMHGIVGTLSFHEGATTWCVRA